MSRELQRNGGRRRYSANKADKATRERAHRPKTCKLAQHPELAHLVAEKLKLQWAPRQIAGWLKSTHLGNQTLKVSHEAIYKTLFIQTRGTLKKEWTCRTSIRPGWMLLLEDLTNGRGRR